MFRLGQEKQLYSKSAPLKKTLEEFINGNMRWCLWLEGAEPNVLRNLPLVMERVEKVRGFRLKSTAAPTRHAAQTPALFFYRSQPTRKYILIPEVSSERRTYIPIGIMTPDIISANTNFLVPSSDLYLFGVLTSAMHMAWVRQVGGRLKSDYRYSGSMVYNTFPWPQFGAEEYPERRSEKLLSVRETHVAFLTTPPNEPWPAGAGRKAAKPTRGDAAANPRVAAVKVAAQAVLDTRSKHTLSTLADLYDPLTMPADLVATHTALDRAVDRCYQKQPFTSDTQRLELLFALYEQYTAPLLPPAKPQRRPKQTATSSRRHIHP